MTPAAWLTLAGICITGAMSPGPSLALVLARTVSGGRRAGALAAVGHGIGVGIYAGLAVGGVAVVLTASPLLVVGMQLAGAGFLAWMGVGLLRSDGATAESDGSKGNAFTDGFALAFLNPKIAVFFLALFSQLADPNATAVEKIGMGLMAGVIDTGWYMLVALALGGPKLTAWLADRSRMLHRLMGVLLIGLAGWMIASLVLAQLTY